MDVWWFMQLHRFIPPLRVASAVGLLVLGTGIAATSASRLRWLADAYGLLDLLIGDRSAWVR